MNTPADLQIIGHEVAIRWDDGKESYIPFATLRAASPSAEVRGERDIFGTKYGGEPPKNFEGIEVKSWERVGSYAIRFVFSDGHGSGLYPFDYRRRLGDANWTAGGVS